MPEHPFAPVALDEYGKAVVCCERCGSTNLEFDGWDIDKCRDCGHWRYRGTPAQSDHGASTDQPGNHRRTDA